MAHTFRTQFRTQVFTALSFLMLIVPFGVSAGPIIRSGDEVPIDANQVLEGDFYAFGGTVTLSGTAKEDVLVAGGTVVINGDIQGDLMVLGGVVQVHGAVADDIRVVGGEVTVAEAVGGDVVVAGGTLNLLSTAEVFGDVIFLGQDVRIDAQVTGSVFGSADTIRINGPVGGDVDVRAMHGFSLGDKASIQGDVEYTSSIVLDRAQGAVVEGEIRQSSMVLDLDNGQLSFFLGQVFVLAFAALTGYLLARRQLDQIVANALSSFGMKGLLGLAVFLGTPFVGLVLVMSVLGALVGVALFLGYIFILLTALAFSGVVLGTLLQQFLRKGNTVSLLTVLLGTFGLSVIALVPFIGPLIVFLFVFVTLGSITSLCYRSLR